MTEYPEPVSSVDALAQAVTVSCPTYVAAGIAAPDWTRLADRSAGRAIRSFIVDSLWTGDACDATAMLRRKELPRAGRIGIIAQDPDRIGGRRVRQRAPLTVERDT